MEEARLRLWNGEKEWQVRVLKTGGVVMSGGMAEEGLGEVSNPS